MAAPCIVWTGCYNLSVYFKFSKQLASLSACELFACRIVEKPPRWLSGRDSQLMLPIGTDNRLSRRPTANYVIIALNIIVFIAPYVLPPLLNNVPGMDAEHHYTRQSVTEAFYELKLNPQHPQVYEFITYAFLHGGFGHIFGNMFFLWVFGNNINDRLGHVGYTLLYLGGAVFSGLGHALFYPSPVLGASGAVATVTGAYMVLFPKTYIKILNLFIVLFIFEVPAIWFILFKLIILDNVLPLNFPYLFTNNIAYGAHLAGYGFGFVISMTMLAAKLLPRSHFDLLALVQRWRRRQQFTQAVYSGHDPFRGVAPGRKTVYAKVKASSRPDPHAEQIAQLRGEISNAIYAADYDTAATLYQRVLTLDPEQVLPQQQQLDVANKLMEKGRHADAARAYSLFLENHKTYPFKEQIHLMLGLLYSRYLERPDDAITNLEEALKNLPDSSQQQMCHEELEKLKDRS